MKLSDLKLGQTAIISKIIGIKSPYKARLLAMGLTPGSKIKIIKIAPLGDPIVITVRNFNLIIRQQEAEILEVAFVD